MVRMAVGFAVHAAGESGRPWPCLSMHHTRNRDSCAMKILALLATLLVAVSACGADSTQSTQGKVSSIACVHPGAWLIISSRPDGRTDIDCRTHLLGTD